MNKNQPQTFSRRKFIRNTAFTVAAFNILPSTLVHGGERVSFNDRLNVAGIGCGSRGSADIDEVASLGHNMVALCDVDQKNLDKRLAKYPGAATFKDFRKMFDKVGKEIDAVVIGTPDHVHAVAAMAAMRHGKHIYCEKPLAHNVHEVRALMAAAHKYKVVTQLGNQGHSSDSIRRVCEWIWSGAIGKVHTIHAGTNAFPKVYCQIPNLPKLKDHEKVPEGLDYNLWVGPVSFQPYSHLWVHWNWRGWLHFGGGAVGDWICHVVDPSFWALDLGAPSSIRAEAPGYDVATQGMTYPAGSRITYEFPAKGGRGPVKLVWHDGNIRIPWSEKFGKDDKVPETGAVIFGEKGMIVHGSHGGGGCMLVPEELMDQYSDAKAPPQKIPRVKGHAWDWVEAIKTGRQAGSNFDYGGPLSELGLLGLVALRFPEQTLQWDGPKARFTNHRGANAMVNPSYRFGWRL